MRRLEDSFVGLAILATLVGARSAFAVDGVAEVNHASALAGGVTPGDAPGYPVTLVGPGSFRLTGGLTPPAGQSAIVISGSRVTLDLNGFSIEGTAVCTGFAPPICSTHGGDGIRQLGQADQAIAIRNGTIRGMDRGINLQGSGTSVERVSAIANQLFGIILGSHATVQHSFASSNGSDGIFVDRQGYVSESEAESNGAGGIGAGSGSIVSRNRSFSNWTTGISMTAPGLVTNNVVQTNNGSQNTVLGGIFASSPGSALVRVEGNVMFANGQGDLKGPAVSSALDNVCTNVQC